MKLRRALAGVAILSLASGNAAAVLRTSSTFRWDPIWRDGKAEVATYIANGGPLPGHDWQIILDQQGDRPGKTLWPFEMILLRDRRVGQDTLREKARIYLDYQLEYAREMVVTDGMDSIRVRAGGPVRERQDVREGGAVVHGLLDIGPALEYVRSRQSGRRKLLRYENARGYFFYEALPVWLRGFDLTIPGRESVSMLPEQTAIGDSTVALVPAVVEIVGPAGRPSETSHGGLEVDVRYEGKVDKLWFHPGPGHVLLAWDKADGTMLRLKSQRRE